MLRLLLILPAILLLCTGVRAQQVYDLADVSKVTRRIDTMSKTNMPLYKVLNLEEGMYRTYEAFASQKPDAPIAGIVDEDRLRKAWFLTPDNKKGALINPTTIYAVVFKGTPYISTQWGYYPTYRKNGEYGFSGYAPTGCKELMGMKIDFRTGRLVAAQ